MKECVETIPGERRLGELWQQRLTADQCAECIQVMKFIIAGEKTPFPPSHLPLSPLSSPFSPCRSVQVGLKYKFFPSWANVLRVLGSFYRVAGRQCHTFLAKVSGYSGVCLYTVYVYVNVHTNYLGLVCVSEERGGRKNGKGGELEE